MVHNAFVQKRKSIGTRIAVNVPRRISPPWLESYRILQLILIHDLNVYKKFKQNLAYMDFVQNFLSTHWE